MTDGFNYVASVTNTSDTNHSDVPNDGYDGVIFLVNVSALDTADANETYDFVIQGKDELSDTYYTLLDSGDIASTGTGLYVLEVHPTLPSSSNDGSKAQAEPRLLPDTLRLRLDVGGTTPSITYTVRVVFS